MYTDNDEMSDFLVEYVSCPNLIGKAMIVNVWFVKQSLLCTILTVRLLSGLLHFMVIMKETEDVRDRCTEGWHLRGKASMLENL